MRFGPYPNDSSRKLLACYLPLGDPLLPASLADVYVECGVDIVEVGLPHPDPILDGPLIRDSMARSLESGVTPQVWQRLVSELRLRYPDTYLVAMGYVNVVPYVASASCGYLADAVLHVGHSIPVEVGALEMVVFVSTDLLPAELEMARQASGYVMLQANEGKTGLRQTLPPESKPRIVRLREAGVAAPILLGIGVSTPEQCREAVELGADGVVMGSACVHAATQGEDRVWNLLTEVRRAIDG